MVRNAVMQLARYPASFGEDGFVFAFLLLLKPKLQSLTNMAPRAA